MVFVRTCIKGFDFQNQNLRIYTKLISNYATLRLRVNVLYKFVDTCIQLLNQNYQNYL